MIAWKREVIELATLTLARFTDLTESELKVLVAVTTGETAYCGPSADNNHPHNNPDYADFWGLERDIRAELIRWMCVSRDAASWIDPRGLRIHAARIGGNLDLSFAVVRFAIALLRCRIADAMNLQSAQIEFLQLSGSLTTRIIADGLIVHGEVLLNGGFRADGEVRLPGSNIGGSLDCENGKFVKPDGAALNADGAQVAGAIFLCKGFSAEGEVSLVRADIGLNLQCHNGKFAKADGHALAADGVRVAGNVFLNNGFSADGEVRLLGANIGGNLECDGGKFVKLDGYALSADRVKVIGSVFLRDGFSVDGQVRLCGADIGGDLEISHAEFTVGSRLDLDRAIVKGGFFWRDLGADGKGALDLRHASVGPVADEQESWPTSGNLNLDGFVYSRIAAPADRRQEPAGVVREATGESVPAAAVSATGEGVARGWR